MIIIKKRHFLFNFDGVCCFKYISITIQFLYSSMNYENLRSYSEKLKNKTPQHNRVEGSFLYLNKSSYTAHVPKGVLAYGTYPIRSLLLR